MRSPTSLDTANLVELLGRLARQQPTRKTIDALLREHGALLARLFRAGWDDETMIAAFHPADGAANPNLEVEAFRRFLREARRRDRIHKRHVSKLQKEVVTHSVKKRIRSDRHDASQEQHGDDLPINDGID